MSATGWTPVEDTSAWTPVEATPEGTGKGFEEQNKLSPNDRQANEFLLGLTSSASGLSETEHPIKDTLKALAQPPSAREVAISSLGPGAGLARGIYDIGKELFSPKQEGESDEDAAARRSHAVGKAFGQVLPLMIGERAGEAPAIDAASVKNKIPNAEKIGAALRDPETNAIKPGVEIAVKGAGIAGGHLLGIPGAGELGGYLLSGKAADWLIPDHPEFLATKQSNIFAKNLADLEKARQTELSQFGRLKTMEEMRLAKEARLAAKNAPKPEPSNPFKGMTTTTPAEVQTMPVRSMSNTPAGAVGGLPRAENLPKGALTPFPAKFVNKFAEPAVTETNPLADDLISRTQRLVEPGAMPTAADLKRAGDLTQTPLLKLRALAKFGDKLAQNELNRRMKQE